MVVPVDHSYRNHSECFAPPITPGGPGVRKQRANNAHIQTLYWCGARGSPNRNLTNYTQEQKMEKHSSKYHQDRMIVTFGYHCPRNHFGGSLA
ncbi:hypothetical protein F751_2356 [Auxenochlorella protothecoides]|uniref:Uncharacterized protein n=1 Tax=Auxenochlorella protothecoides TaxID=3075 RepID=A0A087SFY4_AUXPR|nr:hypothetical protein F751_2356 [Auxenochlorella protothecoides]KFM24638.1 hypothetical protein F751_2356 [Auxenochlorella protothecoides]